jgi:hypothetical protein
MPNEIRLANGVLGQVSCASRRHTTVVRRLLPVIGVLMLLPGVFIAAWLIGDGHRGHLRAEARTLVTELAEAEQSVHARTGGYTDDVDRLVDEAHAQDLARKHGIDAYAGEDVFEVTAYSARYGGRDSYTISVAHGTLQHFCKGHCDGWS